MSPELQRYRFLGRRLPAFNERRIVVLTGARQVGKTTLVRGIYPQLRYFTLDVIEDREALAALHTRSFGRIVGNAVLDEIQKAPALFDKVKFAYDEGEIGFAVLTGSSRILLLEKVRESLAGRAFVYELWPLMPSEIAAPENREPAAPLVDRLLAEGGPLGELLRDEPERGIGPAEGERRSAIEHLLKWGGMPELLGLSDESRREWLRSYQTTWLERDLLDLDQRPELEPFRKLQRLAMLRSGQLLNYAGLARDAGIAPASARRYLEYLRISYQVVLLLPYAKNLTSTVVKSPKLYWSDVGLLRQGTGRWGPVDGPLFETLVATECMKWISTSGRDAELFFYRTRSGLEVDLLIRTPAGLVGIEVKARDGARREDAGAMRAVAAAAGPEWRGGMVVHLGDRLHPIDPAADVWSIPAHRLF